MKQSLTKLQEESVDRLSRIPAVTRRGSGSLQARMKRGARLSYERAAAKLGYTTKQIEQQWRDVQDMALLERDSNPDRPSSVAGGLYCPQCGRGPFKPGVLKRRRDGQFQCPICEKQNKATAGRKAQRAFFGETDSLFDRMENRVQGYLDRSGKFHPIRKSDDYNEFLAGDHDRPPKKKVAKPRRKKKGSKRPATRAVRKATAPRSVSEARRSAKKSRRRAIEQRTLSQYVRSQGGIAPGAMYAGELARLGRKESGTTGLINRHARQGSHRQTAEYMMDKANTEGYGPYRNIGDFLRAVELDASGVKVAHHPSRDYAADERERRHFTSHRSTTRGIFGDRNPDDDPPYPKSLILGSDKPTEAQWRAAREALGREERRKRPRISAEEFNAAWRALREPSRNGALKLTRADFEKHPELLKRLGLSAADIESAYGGGAQGVTGRRDSATAPKRVRAVPVEKIPLWSVSWFSRKLNRRATLQKLIEAHNKTGAIDEAKEEIGYYDLKRHGHQVPTNFVARRVKRNPGGVLAALSHGANAAMVLSGIESLQRLGIWRRGKKRKPARRPPSPETSRRSKVSDRNPQIDPKLAANHEMFQGRQATKITEALTSLQNPPDGWKLGDLVYVDVATARGLMRIAGRPEREDSAMVCANRANDLIYLTGLQHEAPEGVKGRGRRTYGEIVELCYLTPKAHINRGRKTEYWHPLGEETGERPRYALDAYGWPLIVGGAYDIDRRGIIN